MRIVKKPIVLAILDGWGYREAAPDNGLSCAQTPTLDSLFSKYPYSLLQASEHFVGLPSEQMGNSEVGHMNIGGGRIISQDFPRIDLSIEQGTLFSQPVLVDFIKKLKASGGTCHLIGLLSSGGVHSHQNHISVLANTLKEQGIPVVLHAFLDGRDTPPCSARTFIEEFKGCSDIPFATVGGRYYGMDRDKRWERVEKAYESIVKGKGPRATTVENVIEQAYAGGITDEFVEPTVLSSYQGMKKGDGVLMANFRADRARQLAAALVAPTFQGFTRSHTIEFAATASLTEYTPALLAYMPAIFEKQEVNEGLGEILAKNHLKQLRIAETEKYAHVTFFFNGGREEPFEGEERILIPSPAVATYDLQPEMSAFILTENLIEHLSTVDVVVVNYANLDMVGHSGNQQAVQKAAEALDQCIKKLVEAVINLGGILFLTADHGNAEMMWDPENHSPHTAHTCNPVPFLGVNLPLSVKGLKNGKLCDIAPTILALLNITPPAVMTGKSLLEG